MTHFPDPIRQLAQALAAHTGRRRTDGWRARFDIGQNETDLLIEPLLDAREVAKLLRIPRSTLYELVGREGCRM